VQRALASLKTSNVSCERQRSPRTRPHGLKRAVSSWVVLAAKRSSTTRAGRHGVPPMASARIRRG
jgi:hypothetical protein